MNPRGLDVVAMWTFSDTPSMRRGEKRAHAGLQRYELADGREWFMASPADATAKLTSLFGAPKYQKESLPFNVEEMYAGKPYDEFRELRDKFKRRQVQRRIWIHREIGGQFRKISHNTWWCESSSRASNAKRTTYNTFRLEAVACLSISVDETDLDWEGKVSETNPCIVEIWDLMVARHGIDGPPALNVGWTSTAAEELVAELKGLGLVSLELDPSRPPRGIKSHVYKGR